MTEGVSARSSNWARVASLVAFVVVWHLAAQLTDAATLPTPYRVLQNLLTHLQGGDLLYHIGVTLGRVVVSFGLAMSIGVAVGIVMGRHKAWDNALDGVLVLALNMPALVVIILCYLWFGLGEFAAILAVTINKFPVVVVNMREGARAVDRDLLQVATAFRLDWSKRLFQVYLPQLYPYLLLSARSGLALVWKIVLVVELIGRSDGVGFMLGIYFQFFDIASILSYSFAFIAVVMAIEYLIIAPVDRHLSKWRVQA